MNEQSNYRIISETLGFCIDLNKEEAEVMYKALYKILGCVNKEK